MPRDKNIFTLNPTSLDMSRSVFPRKSQLKTSLNLGSLVPIYMDEVLPGDTVSMDLANVIRMNTPIAPIMDNIYADVYFFFVPNRLVWSHWEQFCGANDTTAWTQSTPYTIPQADLTVLPNGVPIGSLGDYFGLPTYFDVGVIAAKDCNVSELPLRAYYKIYNDFFRDENNIAPKLYTIGDTQNTNISYDDSPCKAARFHDLFSSCLPAPQKGASVELPLGDVAPIKFVSSSTDIPDQVKNPKGVAITPGTAFGLYGDNVFEASKTYLMDNDDHGFTIDNSAHLAADLSKATAATVNQVRYAFQLQKLLERDARGGTRYQELLLSHFGVRGSDARLQRAEYIAGHRFRINVDQVLSTANTAKNSTDIGVIGQTGAVSKTAGSSSMFTKSFTEHGLLIGIIVIRQDHTYSEGIDRYFSKKNRFDFYYPVLANIGEQPVYKSEISARILGTADDIGEASGVFGYQEAWYEYRFKPSRCTGYLNPSASNSLNYWTLGDVYSTTPSLGQTFIEETPSYLDRALAVGSSLTHQFIADFYFDAKWSRVMPLYSIPGLIDHH